MRAESVPAFPHPALGAQAVGRRKGGSRAVLIRPAPPPRARRPPALPLLRASGALGRTPGDSLPGDHSPDPLPSWNDGPAKAAIIGLVKSAADPAGPNFVAPEARVATFDQDGTTWVEHPVYTQVIYCLERVPAVVAARPELKDVEPFKTVLSGDREAIARLPLKDLEEIAAATFDRHDRGRISGRSDQMDRDG